MARSSPYKFSPPVMLAVKLKKETRIIHMSYIRITRYPYEEPHHVHLVLEASNGSQKTVFEYYCNATDLNDMASSLEEFPRYQSDVYLYELGSEKPEDKWSYYFQFRAFTTNGVGGCAIKLRTNNKSELPNREISEFCIQAESSQINRLGQLLKEFSHLEHEVLEWTVAEGKLVEFKKAT